MGSVGSDRRNPPIDESLRTDAAESAVDAAKDFLAAAKEQAFSFLGVLFTVYVP